MMKHCYNEIEGTLKIIQRKDFVFYIKLLKNLMSKWTTLCSAEET